VVDLPEIQVTITKKPTLFLVIAAFLVIGAAFLTQLIPYRQIIESNRQVEAAQAELQMLEDENARLQTDVAALETPEEIERLAREKLGYARPGETAYVVLDPPGAGKEVARQEQAAPAPERTWVERIWDFISGGDQQY
jgi:cell division protein FtsL